MGKRVGISTHLQAGFSEAMWTLAKQGAIVFPVHPKTSTLDRDRLTQTFGIQEWITDLGSFSPSPVDVDVLTPFLDRPFTAIQTSGSSGRPKLVIHTLGQHLAHAALMCRNLSVHASSRIGMALPMHHVGGLAWVFRAWVSGATLVFGEDFSQVEVLNRQAITHVSWVPTQMVRALQQPEVALPALKAILVGGAGVDVSVLSQALGRGWPVMTTYGMTEMASTVALAVGHDGAEVIESARVKIDDQRRVWVKGDSLMLGYLDADQIHLTLDEEGFFLTGDSGLWVQGKLDILGRTDDMIIRGGENIWPAEIEAALLQCTGVTQAVVVPKSDREFGHVPVAFIRASFVWQEQDILTDLRSRLPGFKCPSQVLELPDSLILSSGKVDRLGLVKLLESPL
jgi:O-succinylbenzoic acid--CoA ligase